VVTKVVLMQVLFGGTGADEAAESPMDIGEVLYLAVDGGEAGADAEPRAENLMRQGQARGGKEEADRPDGMLMEPSTSRALSLSPGVMARPSAIVPVWEAWRCMFPDPAGHTRTVSSVETGPDAVKSPAGEIAMCVIGSVCSSRTNRC